MTGCNSLVFLSSFLSRGKQGARDNADLADALGSVLNVPEETVVTASTGIIGHLLPMPLGFLDAKNWLIGQFNGVDVAPGSSTEGSTAGLPPVGSS